MQTTRRSRMTTTSSQKSKRGVEGAAIRNRRNETTYLPHTSQWGFDASPVVQARNTGKERLRQARYSVRTNKPEHHDVNIHIFAYILCQIVDYASTWNSKKTAYYCSREYQLVIWRGTIVNRTYGTHKHLNLRVYFAIFTITGDHIKYLVEPTVHNIHKY